MLKLAKDHPILLNIIFLILGLILGSILTFLITYFFGIQIGSSRIYNNGTGLVMQG